MRFDVAGISGLTAAALSVAAMDSAVAQTFSPAPGGQPVWSNSAPESFGPPPRFDFDFDPVGRLIDAHGLSEAVFAGPQGLTAARSRDVWRRNGDGSLDRLRVRWDDTPSPLPEGSIERARLEAGRYDVAYVRGWPLISTARNGVQVELTPHAGVAMNSEGGAAEAGATIRVGELEVMDGRAYEEDQGRWYLFAAGNRRAVGLNWVRGMDGGWGRQGISHDTGSYIGDAQIGVAWRRGDTQASFGYVHREYTAEGVHGGTGIDRDATQGFVAFQFSIRPDW